MKLTLELKAIPPCLRESLRCVLKPHGIELPEHVLVEAGNNLAQALFSIDETPAEEDDQLAFDGPREHPIGVESRR